MVTDDLFPAPDGPRPGAGRAVRAASLFTGIGGLDLALGVEPVVQVERDPYCLDVLALRWPGVERVTDVRDYHPEPGSLDLVFGGPPCQPVSHAGRRKGDQDDRWLWPEALRVVREAMPRSVFFENPMGIRTLGLDGILAELSEMGYGGAWEVVAAADVGAPHLRKRIFIMGVRGRIGWEGTTRPKGNRAVTWPTPTSTSGERGGRGDLLGAVRGYPSPSGHLSDNLRGPALWPTPTTRDHKDTGDSVANGTVPVNSLLGRAVEPSRERGALNPDWVEWLMNCPIGWTDVTKPQPGPLYGWESEPAIPRVGLGIPNRAKRLTALGNAVVPAQGRFAFHRLDGRIRGGSPVTDEQLTLAYREGGRP